VAADMRSKLHPIYQDAEVSVLENRDAFPRAYVVPEGRYAGDAPLSEMIDTAFDPRREVLLESEPPFDVSSLWQPHAATEVRPAGGPREQPVATPPPDEPIPA